MAEQGIELEKFYTQSNNHISLGHCQFILLKFAARYTLDICEIVGNKIQNQVY